MHGIAAMARVAGNTPNTDQWIIDSGATHRITPNLTDFHDHKLIKGILRVEPAVSVV